jgi:trans-2,3-dihydro-3-hydroxyanthranilate isomerase
VIKHRYLHLDVFTDKPFSGNQLAVFPQGSGISSELMQTIAAEINYSETTFVLPPATNGTDCRMRIFTPGAELPMAGHPTIGSTFALAREGVIATGAREFVFGLRVGPTPVRLDWEADRLRFVWMRQPVPEFSTTVDDLNSLAVALGVDEADVSRSGPPPQVVSSGVPLLFVPLSSRRAVDATVLDRPAIQRLYEAVGLEELPVFVFSLESADDDATVYSRMFAPSFGIAEDPATGGASGPLGAYLVRYGAVGEAEAEQMISLQGVRMGRPSRVHISIRGTTESIEEVEVGGVSVHVGEGTIEL